jgi:hypothetical protein
VIVVLASRFDASAARLAERWRDRGARLLTPEGLSLRGWRHESNAPERCAAVFHNEVVPSRAIKGVLTRLSAVSEDDLPHIVLDERAYVSAEMTAFLLAWLSSLECRVLNRPTPTCLSGPSWRQEQWVHEAARGGFLIRPLHRVARRFKNEGAVVPSPEREQSACDELFHVTRIGDRLLGEVADEQTKSGLHRLAQATNVELLTATFARSGGSSVFVGASPWIDIDRPEVADAILECWDMEP